MTARIFCLLHYVLSDILNIINGSAGAASILTIIQTVYQISTAISKTVGPTGADFLTLTAAVNWLSGYVITSTGSVTFILAAGQFTATTPVNINHPNSDRLTIQGNLLASAPTRAGFHVTGNNSTARGNDAVYNLTYLRSIYATELRFTSGSGGIYCAGKQPTLVNLLITGDATGTEATGANGLTADSGAILSNVSVHGFGGAGVLGRQSLFTVLSGKVLTVCACGVSASGGIDLQTGGQIVYAGAVISIGNGTHGAHLLGSTTQQNAGGSWSTDGNLLDGTNADVGSSHSGGASSTYSYNGGNGVKAYLATVQVSTAVAQANGTWAVQGDNSRIHADAMGFPTTNGSGTIYANLGTQVAAVGAGVNGTESPAVNTNGNSNSFIKA